MDKTDREEGELLYKTSCDSCGSSDANAIYSSDTSYCFSCGKHAFLTDRPLVQAQRSKMNDLDLLDIESKELKARKIPLAITKQYKYGSGVLKNGTRVQVAQYYNEDKELVGQKYRTKNKDFKFIGKSKEALMFGQQLYSSGGLKLTITEGEIDAMSVATAFDGKYPVVSIKDGAQSAKKELIKNLEWISSFKEIYLWFDNDEPGRLAVEEACSVLPIDKVKIITHSEYKDANEVLVNKGKGGVSQAFYSAEPYKPEGFVTPDELMEEALKPIEWGLPWFLEKLTNISYGRRYGEVVAVGAGVSVGKTDFIQQQMAFDIKQGYKIATFMLEQSKVETLLRLSGKIDGKHYHLPDEKYDVDELKKTIHSVNNKLFIYDNFGKIDWETIKDKIRSAVHIYGVRLFYIDNLTALNAHAEDERRNLDALMEEVASLAKELDIWILLVSHLNPPKKGASHEAGGKVEQGQFTGSRAIMRWCQFMLGVERNTLHEDPIERNKGLVRGIKDRFSGKATGQTVGFVYDIETGNLVETDEVDQLEMMDDDKEDY